MDEEDLEMDDSSQTSYLLTLKNKLLDQAGLLRALEDKETVIRRLQADLQAAESLYASTLAEHDEGPISITRVNHELQQVKTQLSAILAHNDQLRVQVNGEIDEKIGLEIEHLKAEIEAKDVVVEDLKLELLTERLAAEERRRQWEETEKRVDLPMRKKLEKEKRRQKHLTNALRESKKEMRKVEKELERCRRRRQKSRSVQSK